MIPATLVAASERLSSDVLQGSVEVDPSCPDTCVMGIVPECLLKQSSAWCSHCSLISEQSPVPRRGVQSCVHISLSLP